MPRTAKRTMARTATLENVYTVVKDEKTVLRTYDFREACRVRRDCAGELVTDVRDTSPAAS